MTMLLVLFTLQDAEALRAELGKVQERIPELQKLGLEIRAKQQAAQLATDEVERQKHVEEAAALVNRATAMQNELIDAVKKVAADAKTAAEKSPDDIELHKVRIEAFRMITPGNEPLPMEAEVDLKALAEKGGVEEKGNLARQYLMTNRYALAREAAEAALKEQPDHAEGLEVAGLSAFALHDWDAAVKHFDAGKHQMVGPARDYKDFWEKEKALREKETAAGTQPRVKLTTNKGEIELELFEDDAPNTVANFIELIEKKFYDGVKFHRVIPNFMAQGGDPEGTGAGGPGYSFADEVDGDYRRHFRGSISMANVGPNTNGSQFFLTHLPTPWLNGKHTVFGRVLKGQEIIDGLAVGDAIEKAEVIRKRDHEYKVKKAQ